jgi:hypothetical protein
MSKQLRRYAQSIAFLSLLTGTVLAVSPAEALTVSKGAVSHLGTCGDGHGLPGCTFCSPSQQKCYMVQGCKGKKCTVITVEARGGTKSGSRSPIGVRQTQPAVSHGGGHK